MHVKEVKYAMLRKTEQFENDRVEITIELDAADKVGDAVKTAKRYCEKALATDPDFEYEGF